MAQGNTMKAISFCNALKFNGGGHINHQFFWESLASKADSHLPEEGSITHTKLTESFGTIDNFIKQFSAETVAIMGSGWGWLVFNKQQGKVMFRHTKNQDLISDRAQNLVPLLNIDVWEHAYYLDYKNSRPQYLKNLWQVVNWQKVEERLAAAVHEAQVHAQF